ncbi:sperm-tail PG-rich repeat-containing protein 2-like [Orussus abietinus]|uniref:sperm-tail PG-rich repeat-containing protein 2-like n=1 Tax=Orussus abietinus TaxID=222816 RepID=UPI00062611C7|nr:sperm-tail PG-rich repeat-containing protein 2-like [Orussus abietinus]
MSGRQDSPTFSTPGPGTYELEVKPSLGKIHNEKLKELKRASSRVPRYLDALCSRKVREDFPGPNSYDPPKGPFDFHQQCECEDYTPKPPPFGQGAKRFPYSSEDTPGPGIYISKKSAGLRSYTCASFGSHVPRFKEKCQDSFPGPGDYYTGREDLAYKWKSRCKRSCPRIPVRGSDTLSKIEKVDLRDFGISQDFKSKKTRVHHAVFRSTLDPSVASSVLKKSFNVTLGESRPPKDGAKEEQRDEKGHFKQKKKTLRWFAVPLHTYEHCVRRCDV